MNVSGGGVSAIDRFIGSGIKTDNETVPSANHASFDLIYAADNDGRYPLRFAGKDCRVTLISAMAEGKSGAAYSCLQVKPFISSRLSAEDRAALYHRRLAVATFSEANISQEPGRAWCEKGLVGASMLVAKTQFAKGTCLGIYSGEVASVAELYADSRRFEELEYMCGRRSTGGNAQGHIILPDGIWMKANSVFTYDKQTGYAQAREGYNVEMVPFAIETKGTFCPANHLTAFFTTCDITAGEELRWNYEWPSQKISSLLHQDAKQESKDKFPEFQEKRREFDRRVKEKALEKIRNQMKAGS